MSKVTMTDDANTLTQNSPVEAPAEPSASAPVTAAASPSTQTTLERPKGVADEFWDDKAGVKVAELAAKYDELNKFKTEIDAKAAAVPASADKYETKLPADFKMPDGWQVNDADPVWKAGKEFAKANGFTQDQFSSLAKLYIEAQISTKTAEDAQLKAAIKARDEALGPNGAARVDALNTWFKAAFDEKVAQQLSTTLFTPDIIGAFEKISLAMTNQGVSGFRQDGRGQGGRQDGKPENWEALSPTDQRTWFLLQQQEQSRQRR